MEQFNIYRLLKSLAERDVILENLEFFSPAFGNMQFLMFTTSDDGQNLIVLSRKGGTSVGFDEFGRLCSDGECVIFPGDKKHHCPCGNWKNWKTIWFQEGTVIYNEKTNQLGMVKSVYSDNCINYYIENGDVVGCADVSDWTFANNNQREAFLKILANNGLEWDGSSIVHICRSYVKGESLIDGYRRVETVKGYEGKTILLESGNKFDDDENTRINWRPNYSRDEVVTFVNEKKNWRWMAIVDYVCEYEKDKSDEIKSRFCIHVNENGEVDDYNTKGWFCPNDYDSMRSATLGETKCLMSVLESHMDILSEDDMISANMVKRRVQHENTTSKMEDDIQTLWKDLDEEQKLAILSLIRSFKKE